MGPQREESAAGQPCDPRDAVREKQAAAEAAAELVEDGMTVGLGTGSTVAFRSRPWPAGRSASGVPPRRRAPSTVHASWA
jgi:ribose 5-phosphate isomerase A